MGISRHIPVYQKPDGTFVLWSKRSQRWLRLPASKIHPDDLAAMSPQMRQQVLVKIRNENK